MNITNFDSSNLLEVKKQFNKYHEELLSSLINFDRELTDITKVLNTPNSNKYVPTFIEYFKKQEGLIKEETEVYNQRFDTIINEYSSFDSKVNTMVGGNNEAK